jgi:glucose/arabinose dehydrogenase
VHGAGDLLWEVHPGAWYGWPDFSGQRRLDDGDHFKPPGGNPPEPLLLDRSPPAAPAAILAVHSSSDGLDFSPGESFGFTGEAFIAQFGDQAPAVGKVLAPVGYKVVRVDVRNGVSEDFATNKGKENGPATWLGSQGLERPVAVRFDPPGEALYVVDFGVVRETPRGTEPQAGTGVLWRVRRDLTWRGGFEP